MSLDAGSLCRLAAARVARAARRSAGLSQDRFAKAYGINIARLRDLEPGCEAPDRVLVAFVALIDDDPTKVREVVARIA